MTTAPATSDAARTVDSQPLSVRRVIAYVLLIAWSVQSSPPRWTSCMAGRRVRSISCRAQSISKIFDGIAARNSQRDDALLERQEKAFGETKRARRPPHPIRLENAPALIFARLRLFERRDRLRQTVPHWRSSQNQALPMQRAAPSAEHHAISILNPGPNTCSMARARFGTRRAVNIRAQRFLDPIRVKVAASSELKRLLGPKD